MKVAVVGTGYVRLVIRVRCFGQAEWGFSRSRPAESLFSSRRHRYLGETHRMLYWDRGNLNLAGATFEAERLPIDFRFDKRTVLGARAGALH